MKNFNQLLMTILVAVAMSSCASLTSMNSYYNDAYYNPSVKATPVAQQSVVAQDDTVALSAVQNSVKYIDTEGDMGDIERRLVRFSDDYNGAYYTEEENDANVNVYLNVVNDYGWELGWYRPMYSDFWWDYPYYYSSYRFGYPYYGYYYRHGHYMYGLYDYPYFDYALTSYYGYPYYYGRPYHHPYYGGHHGYLGHHNDFNTNTSHTMNSSRRFSQTTNSSFENVEARMNLGGGKRVTRYATESANRNIKPVQGMRNVSTDSHATSATTSTLNARTNGSRVTTESKRTNSHVVPQGTKRGPVVSPSFSNSNTQTRQSTMQQRSERQNAAQQRALQQRTIQSQRTASTTRVTTSTGVRTNPSSAVQHRSNVNSTNRSTNTTTQKRINPTPRVQNNSTQQTNTPSYNSGTRSSSYSGGSHSSGGSYSGGGSRSSGGSHSGGRGR